MAQPPMSRDTQVLFRFDTLDERIQSVENKHVEISTGIVENAIKLEHLASRMDEGLLRIVDSVERSEKKTDTVVERLNSQDIQLALLAAEKAGRIKILSNVKKFAIWAALVFGGASFTRIGELIAKLWGG